MSDLCLLAVSLITQGHSPGWQLAVPLSKLSAQLPIALDSPRTQCPSLNLMASAHLEAHPPEFSRASGQALRPSEPVEPSSNQQIHSQSEIKRLVQAVRSQPAPLLASQPASQSASQLASQPTSPVHYFPQSSQTVQNILATLAPTRPITGGQLYQQRLAALRSGQTYTRLPSDSFRQEWVNATAQPAYHQWVSLLQQEAKAMAQGQGSSRLTVILGDSLSLWFPPEMLPKDRFWLNQGISGDTTSAILQRMSAFDTTNPDTIHVLAGINDLRRGATDGEVLRNLQQIVQRLRHTHPDAKVIVHSILPTRLASLPSDRIRRLNAAIANTVQAEGAFFLNLQPTFAEDSGILRRELTTDGIHLSLRGYRAWESVIASIL